MLAAWGITTGGKPAFIGLAPGSGESADAWRDFLTSLRTAACAGSPLLVISDAHPAWSRRSRDPARRAAAVPHPLCRPPDYADVVGGICWWRLGFWLARSA